MKSKLFPLLLLSVTISCNIGGKDCDYKAAPDFTDDEKVWLNMYQENQQVMFKSNYNDTFTFTITKKALGYKKSWGKCGTSYPSGYIGIGNCDFSYSMDTDCFYFNSYLPYNCPSGDGIIRINKNEDGFSGYFHLCGFPEIIFPFPTSAIDSILINGNYYNQVYIASVDSNSVDTLGIYTAYFNKSKGLLKYEQRAGGIWEVQ